MNKYYTCFFPEISLFFRHSNVIFGSALKVNTYPVHYEYEGADYKFYVGKIWLPLQKRKFRVPLIIDCILRLRY